MVDFTTLHPFDFDRNLFYFLVLKGLDAKRIPVEDKVKYWLDTNMVDKEQELNRQATDDHKDCFNKGEIGSDHAQQSHSDEHPLLELTSTMDAGNIVPLQNLKTVFLVGKEKRKRSPSSPCTADHTPRLSKDILKEAWKEVKTVERKVDLIRKEK